MSFMIVRVVGRETTPVLAGDGAPVLFDVATEAAAWAAGMSTGGVKHQVRPFIGDDGWRAREASRFADGTYEPLPWCTDAWWLTDEAKAIHVAMFAHVSKRDPGMIAFTESADKGAADRQTTMKPGRFFERYFSDLLSNDEIVRYAIEFMVRYEENELRFATTSEEIVHVYLEGPTSCMSHPTRTYDSDVHPTWVYGAGDLAVAYLEKDDEITARAVVYPAKKMVSRTYGDDSRLTLLLKQAGYSYKSDGFKGARLLYIESGNGFVAPYLDGLQRVDIEGGFLVIKEGGDYCCDSTDGVVGNLPHCEHCGEAMHEDDERYIRTNRHDGESWCEACAADGATYCEVVGEEVANDSVVSMNDGAYYWPDWYFEDHGVACDMPADINLPIDETIVLESGEVWSLDHFEEHGVRTAEGEFYDRENLPDHDGFGEPVMIPVNLAALEAAGQLALPL